MFTVSVYTGIKIRTPNGRMFKSCYIANMLCGFASKIKDLQLSTIHTMVIMGAVLVTV